MMVGMDLLANKLTTTITMLCLLMTMEFGPRPIKVAGEVYRVGDSALWTANSNFSYSDWASSKNFHVHDVLLFQYNATNDNVIQVTHNHFRSCNTSSVITTFNSGNDSFTIKSPGHYYFTSNISGHCEAGQKLDVRVLKSSDHPASSQSPIPTPSPSPSDAAAAPSPVENAATFVSHDTKWLLVMSTICVTISGLVVLHHV